MTLLENSKASVDAAPDVDRTVADVTHDGAGSQPATAVSPADDRERSHPPERRSMPRGMRIGRLRIRSVAKIASVFLALGYLVVLATTVVVWNVVLRLGFVDDLEGLVVSALGVDSFEVAGGELFDLVAVGAGALAVLSFLMILLLAVVYNATCLLFGGLAVETTPVRGWRRHRRRPRA